MKLTRFWIALQVLGILAGMACAPSAHAWGCNGHQTVALLAERHLTPAAKTMLLTLLDNNKIDPTLKRVCGNDVADSFADGSTWADDIRRIRLFTGPWHFLDIPLSQTSPTLLGGFCGADGCVTQAISEQLVILKNKTAADPDRAEALRFILHFVGDLHQPLHATNNGDRGGNCVPVKLSDHGTFHCEVARKKYSPNLHGVWDGDLVDLTMEGRTAEEFAADLDTEFASDIAVWKTGTIDLLAWAWEGHEAVADSVYGSLPKKISFEPDVKPKDCTENNEVGRRMCKKRLRLNASYKEEAGNIIEERLAQAGIRLAMILNDAAK